MVTMDFNTNRNGVLNTFRAPGLGTQPSFMALQKVNRTGIIQVSKGQIFQRAGAMMEKVHLLVPAS